MLWNSRMFWKVRATPATATLRGLGGSTSPANSTCPEVGWYMPVRQLKKVVFPAPLGPIRPTISPGWMSRSTLLTAVRPPNCIVT